MYLVTFLHYSVFSDLNEVKNRTLSAMTKDSATLELTAAAAVCDFISKKPVSTVFMNGPCWQ